MATMSIGSLLLVLVFLSSTSVLAEDQCVFTVFVKTGWLPRAGTDAHIGATFYTAAGDSVQIANFTGWGNLLEPNRNYFERNAVDVFSGFGACLDAPICKLNLTSDGTGDHHGWFSDSVQITSAKFDEDCSSHRFSVQQWLATDVYPYSLSVVVDDCVTEPDNDNSHLKRVRKLTR